MGIRRVAKQAKLFILFVVLTCCMVITACGKQSTSKKAEAKPKQTQEQDKDKESKTDTIPEGLIPKGTNESGQTDNQDASNDAQSDAKNTDTYDASKDRADSGTTKKGSGDASRTPSGQSEKSTIQVSISADCSAAVAYGLDVSATPLQTVKVTLKKGQTVYDALAASGVNFSGRSGYVSGIGGVFEKDCGSKSGWTYYVNGTMPNVGCGSYTCKDGDVIKWKYVTG